MELIPGEKVSNPDRVCETTLTMPRVPRCSSSTDVHYCGEKKVLRGEPPLPRILYTYTYTYGLP